jgi:Tfp pilus assembly protein PilO
MKKNKLAVTALLVLLSLSAVGCLFSFVFGKYQDLARRERQAVARDFAGREKAAQAMEQEYRDWRELPGALQRFRRDNLLSMDGFAAFRRNLDARLAANGLQPSRIDLAFGKGQDGIRKVTVKFSLEGAYRSLKKFIFDMESGTRMVFFTDLRMSAGSASVKGAFTLEVYLGE